jgi:hypothetical protein
MNGAETKRIDVIFFTPSFCSLLFVPRLLPDSLPAADEHHPA